MMKYLAAIFFCAVFVAGLPTAHAADQVQAREVARLNNCPPKKIEVYQTSVGTEGATVYRVTCNLPKAVGGEAQKADAVLIGCQDGLCEFMRPVSSAGK